MKECLICHNKCHTGSWGFIETIPGKYTMKNTIYVCEKCNANINLEELKQLMLHNKFQSSIDLKLYIMKNKISRNGREINMEEIKVRDYIRTKNGIIGKIINVNDFREASMKYGVEVNYIDDIVFTGDEKIKKHSSNIIDLIEVGDYVNGEPVEQISEFEITTTTEYITNPKDIKSICTKEQFASAEYKLDN